MKKIFSAVIFLFLIQTLNAQSTRSIVSGIKTEAFRSKINLSWILPKKAEGTSVTALLIYRDTRPIENTDFFKKNKPVATLPPSTTSYADEVRDTREYYYAVICSVAEGDFGETDLYYDEELDAVPESVESKPYYIILPGVNATVTGEGIKLSSKKEFTPLPKENKNRTYSENQMRDLPLPFMDILGDEAEHQKTISREAEDSARSLFEGRRKVQKEFLEPYIFEEDIISPNGGDEYLLFEILKVSFIKRDYKKSVQLLSRFTLQNRNEKVLERARFYLGESYYFEQNFPMALTEFLSLKDAYPSLSHKWIESTLTLFEAE